MAWSKVPNTMRVAVLILALSLVGCTLLSTEESPLPAAGAPTSSSTTCTIASTSNGEVPAFSSSPIAELLPSQMPKLSKAYFSMGCFWGSEGMLGSCPGVFFTRVGFTGGTLPNPSYSAIGDHVETVEVLFDPEKISYSQLLEHFWAHHNAHAKPVFRQYASAVFTVDDRQNALAKAARKARQASSEEPLLTGILPLKTFYPADPGHQKYYLSQDADLLAALPRSGDQKMETRLATKLNALSGHSGDRASLKSSLQELGLSADASEALLARASWPEERTAPHP